MVHPRTEVMDLMSSSPLVRTGQFEAAVANRSARARRHIFGKIDATTVRDAVAAKLSTSYSFSCRTFGQGVSTDEIAAVIQAIPGVVAVNVRNLRLIATSAAGDLSASNYPLAGYNKWLAQQATNLPRPVANSASRICPYLPVADSTSIPYAAEILVLDPDPKSTVLSVML
jgi:hypothetical protein